MITMSRLSKYFGDQLIFSDLNVTFKDKGINIISGPSGCGKTTLLRIIAGLDTDYQGALHHVPDRISYVFQDDRLLPWVDLEANLRFVLSDSMEEDEMHPIIRHYLRAVQLYDHRHKLPSELSGGMLRRAALARAFAYPAPLLLMDEPFKGLDQALKDELIDLFLALQSTEKKTVILVSHDASVLKRLDGTHHLIKDHTVKAYSYP